MRWDYTCHNRRMGTYAVGYCREWRPFTAEGMKGLYDAEQCERENKKFEPYVSKFHTTGHVSKEEACACYKEYLLDHNFRLGTRKDQQNKCQVCGEWTQTTVDVGESYFFTLCEKHATREEVAKLVTVGECWSSY
jgi:hypothetical protein